MKKNIPLRIILHFRAAFFLLIALNSSCQIISAQDLEKKITYLGADYSLEKFLLIKKEEMVKLKNDVSSLPCKLNFKYRNTKYYNVAYRSSEKETDEIVYYLEIFYKKIYSLYFDSEPNFSFRVVIFKNESETSKCTETPQGLYGVYFPYGTDFKSNTLFTYAYSGPGTIWHETMHGFLDANINERLPDWFNEGLASLYEFTKIQNGEIIVGYTNWRQPTLQNAVKNQQFIPLKELFTMQSQRTSIALSEFRFLFLYLNKKNALYSFCKKFLNEIFPKYYSDNRELSNKSIELFQQAIGLTLPEIETEMKELILSVDKDSELQ